MWLISMGLRSRVMVLSSWTKMVAMLLSFTLTVSVLFLLLAGQDKGQALLGREDRRHDEEDQQKKGHVGGRVHAQLAQGLLLLFLHDAHRSTFLPGRRAGTAVPRRPR